MDIDTWKFINSFAPWLAAMGTIAAVIVSLYLARRDRNIRLSVNAKICAIVEIGGTPDDVEEVLVISATNIALRRARLTSFYWKCGYSRKHTYIQLPPSTQDSNSTRLPADLLDGAEANWVIPLGQFEIAIDKLFSTWFSKKLPRIHIGNLKIGAFISTGDSFERRVEKHLKRWIISKYREQKNPMS